MVETAKADQDVLGLLLQGSRGKGFDNEFSDYDVYFIVKDDAVASSVAMYQEPYPDDDISVEAFSDFEGYAEWGSEAVWDRYDFAHVEVLIDRVGNLKELANNKGHIPDEKQKEFLMYWLDGYINGVYRSVKCWRAQNILGARLEASNAVNDLLTVVFAFEKRHRPFLGYIEKELINFPLLELPWDVKAFIEMITRVLSDGNLETQQELLKGIEKLSREKGYGQVFDEWKGKDKWAMMYKPE